MVLGSLNSVISLGLPPMGRGIVLVDGLRAPAVGEMEIDDFAALAAEVERTIGPNGGVIVPGDDGEVVVRETIAARRLADLLRGPGAREVIDRLGYLAGRAEAEGRRLQLMVDARLAALRSLPWELLECLPVGSFPAAGLRVLRAAAGPVTVPSRSDRLEVALWLPREDDLVCREAGTALRESLGRLERVAVREAGSDGVAGDGVFRVVHVVCHGVAAWERVFLDLGEERRMDPASVARWLGPWIAGAQLVVLDVCGGGALTPDPSAVPAWRVVGGGAAACVGPRQPFDMDASRAFSAALYGALALGGSVGEAVDAGRRALVGVAVGHPASRWWNPVLVAAGVEAADARAVVPALVPLPGAPLPHEDGEAIIARAVELGRPCGWVGVEHIALALGTHERPGPHLALLQPQLRALAEDVGAFEPSAGPDPSPTPRLEGILALLPHRFGPDELLQCLAGVRWVTRRVKFLDRVLTAGIRDPNTLSEADDELGGLASGELVFEVQGGPEDGRRIVLRSEGDVLGRLDPDRVEPAIELFPGAWDPGVSRSHVVYLGAGRIEALGATSRVSNGGTSERVEGPLDVRPGDVLVLGRATRIEAIPTGVQGVG